MSYLEWDVQEVLEGFPPPSGMSKASKVEAMVRLESRNRGPLSRPELARILGVTTRTIERYRRELRAASLG